MSKMANSTQLNKDERLRIAEYGLIALDEIDAMGPRELNVMKSVITALVCSSRKPDIAMSAAENKGREDGLYMNVP